MKLRSAFNPDELKEMLAAMDAAWNVLRCSDSELAQAGRADATKTLLARRILSQARSGDFKYKQLFLNALDGLIGIPGEVKKSEDRSQTL